ncbi:MAG: hypothetical protein KAI22_11595 [Gammaproteobacteria bacterium]|nr:hypothetical protein [Gammaproteobacteria bacterium]
MGRRLRLNGVSENRDVFIKRYTDVLERPQADEPVYPAAVWEALIRTAAKVV